MPGEAGWRPEGALWAPTRAACCFRRHQPASSGRPCLSWPERSPEAPRGKVSLLAGRPCRRRACARAKENPAPPPPPAERTAPEGPSRCGVEVVRAAAEVGEEPMRLAWGDQGAPSAQTSVRSSSWASPCRQVSSGVQRIAPPGGSRSESVISLHQAKRLLIGKFCAKVRCSRGRPFRRACSQRGCTVCAADYPIPANLWTVRRVGGLRRWCGRGCREGRVLPAPVRRPPCAAGPGPGGRDQGPAAPPPIPVDGVPRQLHAPGNLPPAKALSPELLDPQPIQDRARLADVLPMTFTLRRSPPADPGVSSGKVASPRADMLRSANPTSLTSHHLHLR